VLLQSTGNRNFNQENIKKMSYRVYECVVCGFRYYEELGLPDHGIAPGTRWADVPATWLCPECGVSKSDFEEIAV
jgi:rubredoxin